MAGHACGRQRSTTFLAYFQGISFRAVWNKQLQRIVGTVLGLTLFLAEAATLGHGMPTGILQARLVDTIVGSLVGLAGGFCLHSPRFREVAGRQLRRLTPSNFSS